MWGRQLWWLEGGIVETLLFNMSMHKNSKHIWHQYNSILMTHAVGHWDAYGDISIAFSEGLALVYLHCHPKQRSVCLS